MTKLIKDMTAREVRAMQIKARRVQNAAARSRGFRNFAEMVGE